MAVRLRLRPMWLAVGGALALVSACATPADRSGPTITAGAPGATPKPVKITTSPSSTLAGPLRSFAATGITPEIRTRSEPDQAVCGYRHAQDSIALGAASATEMQRVVQAGGVDAARAMSVAVAAFGIRPMFTAAARVVSSPVLVTQEGAAHNALLPATLTGRPMYLVNVSGIQDMTSTKAGGSDLVATDAEIYIDAPTGEIAFVLECSRPSAVAPGGGGASQPTASAPLDQKT